MITQAELLERLNQLTLRYNLTWLDIKYDADAAIAKINSYMGTTYPKLSEKMKHPNASYTIPTNGINVAIIDDEYFHSVIIPFIAMQVLARDEEFTTIYNKYVMDLEEGLWNMLQKEFNRVPLVFRQQPNQGVFFASDTAQGIIQRNDVVNLPVFKFRVFYHMNNADAVLSTHTAQSFVTDTHAYLYDEEATILNWSTDLVSLDGTKVFTFNGWRRDPAQLTLDPIDAGTKVKMQADLHLYASWTVHSTLVITNAGVLSLNPTYASTLTYLNIPSLVNNKPVFEIASHFVYDTDTEAVRAPNLNTIIVPSSVRRLNNNAFKGFQGTSIDFVEGGTAPLVIESGAFADCTKMETLLIPANVSTISMNAIGSVSNLTRTIQCRILENNKPDAWLPGWYAATDKGINYMVNVVWGYNG